MINMCIGIISHNYFYVGRRAFRTAGRIEPQTDGTLHAPRSTAHGAQVV